MTKKKITAPLSYDPGKGRPKEYLAYLNWQEMQALQRLNGGNMERGPMGLPSFPPDDSIGSGQTPGTGNWTGSPGSGTTSSGAGSTTGGGSDSGSIGGSVSGTSTSTTSTTSTAGSQQASNDTEAQQAAAEQSAAEAARNEALRQDAVRGGIASINVGPMQNPVQIGGGQIFGSLSKIASETYGAQASVPSYDSLSGAGINNVLSTPYNTVFPENAPVTGRIQDMPGEFRSGGRRLHSGVDIAVKEGTPVTPRAPGTVIQVANSKSAYGPTVQVMSVDGTIDRYALHKDQKINLKPGDPVYQDTVIGRAGALPVKNGFSHLHYEGITQKDPAYSKIVEAMNSGRLAKTTGGVVGSTSNPILGSVSAARAAPKTSTPNIMARMGLSTGDVVAGGVSPTPNLPAYDNADSLYQVADESAPYTPAMMDPVAAATLSGIAQLPSALSNFKIPAIPEPNFVEKMARMGFQRSDPEGFQKQVNAEMADATSGFSLGDTVAGAFGAMNEAMNRPQTAVAQNEIETVEEDYRDPFVNAASTPQKYKLMADAQVYPQNVDPSILRTIEDQEKKNRIGIKVIERAPMIGGPASLVEGIQKIFTGKDIADYGTDLKYKYMQSDEAQKAELRAKYPDIRRFAVSIGDIPPNTGTQFASSGDLSRELGGKDNRQNYYMDQVAYSPPVYSGATKEPVMETGRPYKHYLWDLGVDVPSPGDPDYNDYVKYLKKRDNSSDV